MYNVHFTKKSDNAKIGPIPATVTNAVTCPPSCPFNGSGCYAQSGPVSWHWSKVNKGQRGDNWQTLCENVAALPLGQTWRHNVAGDLPGIGEDIDAKALGELVHANIGKNGFTYTHKTTNPENWHWIKSANEWGFVVNLSANDLEHADKLADLAIGPVVTVLPIDAPKLHKTPARRVVVTCPATYREDINCSTCKLCAKRDRQTIVGFPAHGVSKAKAQKVFFMVKG